MNVKELKNEEFEEDEKWINDLIEEELEKELEKEFEEEVKKHIYEWEKVDGNKE